MAEQRGRPGALHGVLVAGGLVAVAGVVFLGRRSTALAAAPPVLAGEVPASATAPVTAEGPVAPTPAEGEKPAAPPAFSTKDSSPVPGAWPNQTVPAWLPRQPVPPAQPAASAGSPLLTELAPLLGIALQQRNQGGSRRRQTTQAPQLSQYEGRLFRAQGTSEVFVIEGGQKRWIPTEEILNSRYGGISQVTDVPADFLSQFPAGAPIPQPAATPAPSAPTQYEGRLFRAEGLGRVYVIEGGKKRWITNEAILLAGYGGWGLVTDVTAEFLNLFPTGTDVTSGPAATSGRDEGRLFRADGQGRVYLIQGGQKRWVTTEAILVARYGGWRPVTPVPAAYLDQFPAGSDIV